MGNLGQLYKQSLLQSILSGAQQPSATLNETNAAAGAAGAGAANSMAQVQGKQQELQQHQFMIDTQKAFDGNKDKQGHISPDLFNKTKQAATSLGISGGAFDAVFGEGGYVDPKNTIKYNTNEGLATQEEYGTMKRQIQAQLDAYNAIPDNEKTLFTKGGLADIPVLGQLIAPHAAAYESNRNALAAQLKELAGGGKGSGLKVTNVDMSKWGDLLPSTERTGTVNNDKLTNLDRQIKARYNLDQGLDSQYLPNQAPQTGGAFKIIQVK